MTILRNDPVVDDAEDYITWALRCQTHASTRNVLKDAACHIQAQPDDFDADPYLLNCHNGTLNLHTGKLQPHQPADLLTKMANVSFDEGAQCPRWDRFLMEIFLGDDELIRFIQRALGYSLTGSVDEQVFILCYGKGANGKSTLIGLVEKMLGDYAMTAAPGLLVAKKYEAHPTELADLFRTRFVATSEVKTDARWDEERIKQLTGGDKIKARRMREDFWSFEPTHKIWLSANHRPATADNTLAFWRRVKMIPFNATFQGEQRDNSLLMTLMAEAPGVLAWMVRGCLDWQKNGLGSAAAVEVATNTYRQLSDEIQIFVDECCTKTATARIKARELYLAYVHYFEQRHERVQSETNFGQRIRDLGFEVKKSGGMFYLGLELNPTMDPDEDAWLQDIPEI